MNGNVTLSLTQLVEKSRDPAASLDEQHAAFTCLVQQTQHIVMALAIASLRDLDDAEDVAQESFATA